MVDLFVLYLTQILPLQLTPPTGSVHPYVSNMISAALLITVIAIALQFLYAGLRMKMTDLGKMRRIMKETTEWRKEYMDAIRKQDKDRIEKLKKKQQYVNKMQMEMMQMNFKPMIAFMIPMLIIWWAILPAVFGNTVAVSPISLNILGDLIPITCTKQMIEDDVNSITAELETKVAEARSSGMGTTGDQVLALANEAKELTANGNYISARERILEAYNVLNAGLAEDQKVSERVPRCAAENEIFLWAWYAIASIAFSSTVMRITKTGTDYGL
ncbi:MAG: EMC3/TMCO1 family protein [Nitrososphaerales archaeon]